MFRKLGIMDKPGSDLKNTRKPVPTIQGVFVYIGFLVIIGLLNPSYFHQPLFLGLMRGSLPIVLIQFFDEMNYIGKSKREVSPKIRLVSHVL